MDESGIVSLEESLEARGNISAKGCDSLVKIDCAGGGKIHATGKRVYRDDGKGIDKLDRMGGKRSGDRKIMPKGKTATLTRTTTSSKGLVGRRGVGLNLCE